MKPTLRALSVALFVTLAACGGGFDPVGVWSIDPDATLAANQVQIEGQLADVPEADRANKKDELQSVVKIMQGTMEFKADKTLVSSQPSGGEGHVMHGSWEIDGDKVTIQGIAQGDAVTIGRIDSDQGSMTVNVPGTDYFVVLKRSGR